MNKISNKIEKSLYHPIDNNKIIFKLAKIANAKVNPKCSLTKPVIQSIQNIKFAMKKTKNCQSIFVFN